MATDKQFMDYVVEQGGLGDSLTYRKMFGEYALYHAGKVVALVCDSSLFLKPSSAAQSVTPQLPQRAPYPGARLHPVADELLDDSDAFRSLLLATSAALALPKVKKSRQVRGGKT